MISSYLLFLSLLILQIPNHDCSSFSRESKIGGLADDSGDISTDQRIQTINVPNQRVRRGDCCETCGGTDYTKWTCDQTCLNNEALWTCRLAVTVYEDDGVYRTYTCCRCHCFPSSARVCLENGKSVIMSDLQIGDRVQTVSSEGQVKYSEVKTFMKRQHTMTAMYKSFTTSWNNTISLTGNHLIYARQNSTDKFKPMYANEVSVEDEVLVQGKNYLTPSKVIKIETQKLQGAHTPVTMDGNIVVDRVLASCYAFSDHDVAHLIMTSMRWYPETMDWIFGDNNGSPGYVNFLEDLGRLVLSHDQQN